MIELKPMNFETHVSQWELKLFKNISKYIKSVTLIRMEYLIDMIKTEYDRIDNPDHKKKYSITIL